MLDTGLFKIPKILDFEPFIDKKVLLLDSKTEPLSLSLRM